MKRLLFIATYPTQPIGYSTVAHKLSNYLANFYKVYYFGYHNIPELKVERYVDPRINFIDVLQVERERNMTKTYGDDIICEYLTDIRPDIVLIYNDILVTTRILNAFIDNKIKDIVSFKTAVYLDLVYEYEYSVCVRHIDRHSDLIITFSNFWKDHLISVGVPKDKLAVLYHGCDLARADITKEKARSFFNIGADDFVILNTNRNSYRKAIDLTIKAFLIFLKRNNLDQRLKLFLTCRFETNAGYEIYDLITNLCFELDIDLSTAYNSIFTTGNTKYGEPLSDNLLNTLYVASDIGTNTSIGEGFGLCSIEGTNHGKMQVLSAVGSTPELYREEDALAILVKPVASYHVARHTDRHYGLARVCRAEDFANAYQFCYENRHMLEDHVAQRKDRLMNRLKWEELLPNLVKMLEALSSFEI